MAKHDKSGGSSKSRAGTSAGVAVAMPKALKNKQITQTGAANKKKGAELRQPSDANTITPITAQTIRSKSTVIEALRYLVADEGTTSASAYTMAVIAMTKLKVATYDNATGEFNGDAANAVKRIMLMMDTVHDYTIGFNTKPTLRQVIEAAMIEPLVTGAVCGELVLDKNRQPSHIQLIPYEQIKLIANGQGGYYPKQKAQGGGDDIDLNIPNFWIIEKDKMPGQLYAKPMFRSSISTTIHGLEYIEDMRVAINKTGHSRLIATLDFEKLINSAPTLIKKDKVKLAGFLEGKLEELKTALEGLNPEDSVIGFDTVSFEVKDIGKVKTDYVPLLTVINNMQATGLKTPPSIIGMRSEGSQSLSNSETLTYLKMADSLRGPVSDFLSRAFTLAARLYGLDVFVKISFDTIDIRPESELESYRTMRQTRILELLSLGLISDAVAFYELGIPYNAAAPQLSGTNFNVEKKDDGGGTDNTGGMERTLNSDTPKKAGGKSQ